MDFIIKIMSIVREWLVLRMVNPKVMEIRLRSKLKSVLSIILKFCIIEIEVKLDAKNL